MLKFDNSNKEMAKDKAHIALDLSFLYIFTNHFIFHICECISSFQVQLKFINTVLKRSMIASKKYVQCRRSYKDHSIFDVFYMNSNLAEVVKMVPVVSVSDVVRKGKMIGTVYEKEPVINSVQSPISGTIIEIKQIQPQNSKKKMVHIFSMKSCQHFPKDKSQGMSLNPLENKSILHTADICSFCQEPLWVYYDKTEKQVTLGEMKKHFTSFRFCELQWRVVLNEQFTTDTQIGCTSEESFCLPGTGKITYLYDLTKKQPNFDTVVLRYKNIICKHQKIKNFMCLFCLTDMKQTNFPLRRYLFQFDYMNFNPNFVFSGGSLVAQAREFAHCLKKIKKCILVLDLDNTILHSIACRKVSEQMINSIEQYVILPQEDTNPKLEQQYIEKTLVKFRPNLQYFLSVTVNLFEIYIYTKGTRIYAEYICQYIRKRYLHILKNTKNFLNQRIMSRNQDSIYDKKNLDYVIPQNRQVILILDDRRDVWDSSPLCVFTRPYIFFYSVSTTGDGKTKLKPVEWEKGGGTLEHKLNEFEQNCIKQIKEAEHQGKQDVAAKKIKELKDEMASMQNEGQEGQMVICVPESSLQAKTQEKEKQQQERRRYQSRKKQVQLLKTAQKASMYQKQQRDLRNYSNIPDQFLVTTAFALKQAHTIFFQRLQLPDDEHKKEGKYTDLSYCFKDYKKSLLDHLTVCFVHTFKDFKKYGAFGRAQKLGLKIVDNLNDHIDLIIRPNNFLAGYHQSTIELANKHYNEVVKKIKLIHQVRKIPIVSQSWIDICYEFNCCVHHSYFEPENPLAKAVYVTDHQLRKPVGESTLNVAQKIKFLLSDGADGEGLEQANS